MPVSNVLYRIRIGLHYGKAVKPKHCIDVMTVCAANLFYMYGSKSVPLLVLMLLILPIENNYSNFLSTSDEQEKNLYSPYSLKNQHNTNNLVLTTLHFIIPTFFVTIYWTMAVLLLSGDIELNPGPSNLSSESDILDISLDMQLC
jgi:hypothetical protein